MKFRPCIDIHNGKVKQIVGGSLTDESDQAVENYTASAGADVFAARYRADGLTGGHIILLNAPTSPYYDVTRKQALSGLKAFPGGMQIGGGITAENAMDYLEQGASHVIVTSYVFQGGRVRWEHMKQLTDAVGKRRIVLDLSCRKRNGSYYIVTDRWQKFTEVKLTPCVLKEMSRFCDEYLIHGVDVEGRSCGFQTDLVEMLGQWNGIPITYAGGIGSMADLNSFRQISGGHLDVTIGSALDIFGGPLSYDEVKQLNNNSV